MYQQIINLNPYKLALAFFTWIFIVAAMLTLTSCVSSRWTKGEGCQNGYAGYGQKAQVIKGSARKGY